MDSKIDSTSNMAKCLCYPNRYCERQINIECVFNKKVYCLNNLEYYFIDVLVEAKKDITRFRNNKINSSYFNFKYNYKCFSNNICYNLNL